MQTKNHKLFRTISDLARDILSEFYPLKLHATNKLFHHTFVTSTISNCLNFILQLMTIKLNKIASSRMKAIRKMLHI